MPARTYRAALAIAILALPACSRDAKPVTQIQSVSTRNGEVLTVSFATLPSPPRSGQNEAQVMLHGADGKAIDDAAVVLDFYMPAMSSMNMPEMHADFRLTHRGGGLYTGNGTLEMPGTWSMNTSISRPGAPTETARFTVIAK
jgi:hypothetical protein